MREKEGRRKKKRKRGSRVDGGASETVVLARLVYIENLVSCIQASAKTHPLCGSRVPFRENEISPSLMDLILLLFLLLHIFYFYFHIIPYS